MIDSLLCDVTDTYHIHSCLLFSLPILLHLSQVLLRPLKFFLGKDLGNITVEFLQVTAILMPKEQCRSTEDILYLVKWASWLKSVVCLQASCSCVQGITRPATTVPGCRLSALDRHWPPITAIGWCLDVCHKKNTNASRRQGVFPSLDRVSGTLCLLHYVTETSHLYRRLKTFWFVWGCSA